MNPEHFYEWIARGGNPGTERLIGGVVPAYPIFMFAGIIAVIIACIVQLKIRNIPLADFEWAILITVPLGILGGSVFGKIFMPNLVWYHVFFFWEPGMSLFGAVGLGFLAGFTWFYARSRKTMISVWVYADCIVPNILLGQAIGRWGNLYNHEILGPVVSYDSLQWLAPGIRNKLWYFPEQLGQIVNPPQEWWLKVIDTTGQINQGWVQQQGAQSALWNEVLNAEIQYRAPLFLYESIANFLFWILLTFVISNLSRWIQKKGTYPWDDVPNAYPGWFNHKGTKYLALDEIPTWPTQKKLKLRKTKKGYTMSLSQAWNKAYYWNEPDPEALKHYEQLEHERIEHNTQLEDNWTKAKEHRHQQLGQLRRNYDAQINRFGKNSFQGKQAKQKYQLGVQKTRADYKTKAQSYSKQLGGWTRYFKPNPLGPDLENLFNPHHYFILRSGVLTGSYFVGYTLYRIGLETMRLPREYFVQNQPVANFIVLSLIVIFGILIILWAQCIAPKKYRELGWLYERSY